MRVLEVHGQEKHATASHRLAVVRAFTPAIFKRTIRFRTFSLILLKCLQQDASLCDCLTWLRRDSVQWKMTQLEACEHRMHLATTDNPLSLFPYSAIDNFKEKSEKTSPSVECFKVVYWSKRADRDWWNLDCRKFRRSISIERKSWRARVREITIGWSVSSCWLDLFASRHSFGGLELGRFGHFGRLWYTLSFSKGDGDCHENTKNGKDVHFWVSSSLNFSQEKEKDDLSRGKSCIYILSHDQVNKDDWLQSHSSELIGDEW